ncbi:hypothetical protein [uncultured Vibrio sp.]|uniref:hypothetical protein n=1 Tax=uncultured Vibrio sp. TaxID=114054 RepID=UPI00260D8CC6|nr:hypothetical protein [uncultured Vibrio sp.]
MAGNAFKVWFPEMLEELALVWDPKMGWDDIIPICDVMTKRREVLRVEKNIKNPIFYCEDCDDKHSFKHAPITIRSMLYALKKASLIDDLTLMQLDRDWKKYQRHNKLNGAGHPKMMK